MERNHHFFLIFIIICPALGSFYLYTTGQVHLKTIVPDTKKVVTESVQKIEKLIKEPITRAEKAKSQLESRDKEMAKYLEE